MAFAPLPQTHIVGLDVVAGGSTVTGADTVKYLLIPLTSIPQLSEAECDETPYNVDTNPNPTGNISKIAFALAEKLYQLYAAMAVADRPAKWSSYRSPGTPDNSGVREATYTNRFTVVDSATEVQAE
jgi:hypothetical protein